MQVRCSLTLLTVMMQGWQCSGMTSLAMLLVFLAVCTGMGWQFGGCMVYSAEPQRQHPARLVELWETHCDSCDFSQLSCKAWGSSGFGAGLMWT